jgi:hypothetical protein
VTAKLNIHLEGPVSTQTVRRELRKSNIQGRATIARPLITVSNLRCVYSGVTSIKPGHQTTRNARYGQMSRRPLLCSMYHKEFKFREHRRMPTIRNSRFQLRMFCGVFGSNVAVFCWPHYLSYMAELLQGCTWTG